MRILVLGGGYFGYHFVAEALAGGHEVSTFGKRPSPGWRRSWEAVRAT